MIIKYKEEQFECKLDAEDEEFFSKWNWQYRCGYAGRKRSKTDPPGNRWVHLHHEVLIRSGIIIPFGLVIDHSNRDRMDNRKINLRVVTKSENSLNVSSECKSQRRENVKKATAAAAKKERTVTQLNNAKLQASNMNKSGSNKHIGEDHVKSKKLINTSTKEIYVNLRDAAQKLNMNYSTLRNMLNGYNPNKTNLVPYHNYHPKVRDEE